MNELTDRPEFCFVCKQQSQELGLHGDRTEKWAASSSSDVQPGPSSSLQLLKVSEKRDVELRITGGMPAGLPAYQREQPDKIKGGER
eukprot:746332-Hanusia_phi.AAC.3